MRLESHLKKLKQHLAGLEWGIKQNNESATGFHASAGSVELLSILLRKLRLVSVGFQINHRWFSSPAIVAQKFGFDFPRKEEALNLMRSIEELRNPLCYGSPGKEAAVDAMMEDFHRLKRIIEEELDESLG